MPKFLTFKSPSSSDLKENPLKALYESFLSFDKFTKGFLIVLVLILISTPFLVNNLLIFKPHAQEIEPTLGEQTPPIPPSVPDEILIKFKAGVSDKAKEKASNEHGLTKLDEIKQIGVEKVKVPADKKDQIIEALKHNPQVKYAEPNYLRQAQVIPNDPAFPNQWPPPKIAAPIAWDISTGAPSAIIAILDTGVDLNHEDLIGKVSGTQDDNGHGTQVAGLAGAATNNGKGIAGVCWLCPLLSVKVLNATGSGGDSGIAKGITYAADNGAKIINLSLGSYVFSQTMQDAVNYAWNKGVVVVGAAGNDSVTNPFYPAAMNNVVAVGSVGSSDSLSSTSNYGPWIDVVAPGVSVSTTLFGNQNGNIYGQVSGTSMAAPHVAGLAGLIISANSSLNNQQVVDIITSTTDDLGTAGKDDTYGYGRINACNALKAAVPSSSVNCNPSSSPSPSPTPSPSPIPTPTPDTTQPSVTITSPISGSTVSGSSVSFNVDATDNVGVTKVEFYADNVLLPNGTEVSAPYTASWDSTTYSNSSHTLSAKAYDNAGNVGTSASVTVTVNNIAPTPTPTPTLIPPTPTPTKVPSSDTISPTVIITNPLNGSNVAKGSTVTITASPSDNVGITKIEFYIGGSTSPKCTDTTPPYTCTWKVPGRTNATYTLTAKAYDPSGNTGTAGVVVTGR